MKYKTIESFGLIVIYNYTHVLNVCDTLAMKTLPDLIKSVGEAAFSDAIGVSIHTTRSYRYKQRLPRPNVAEKILNVYGKLISYQGIYGAVNGK